MANISAELAAIQAAILGEEVRGSIHDAIDTINKVSEKIFITGSTNPTGNAMYSKLLYLNTTTYDLFQSADTAPYIYSKIGNIEGNAITSITGPVQVSALVDRYTINFSKLPTPVTFDVAQGKGITSIVKESVSGLVDTYRITYNDGTTQDYDVTNGKGIASIVKETTAGLVDTYKITYTDGTTQTYDITNGKGIASITKTAIVGLTDTYTITYTDGTTGTYDVTNGKGIVSIALKATVGLTDTYTITYNDGTTQDYDVVNGRDGNTVIRGNEVTGTAILPTQFVVSVKTQEGDTYINITGNVYTCTQGAPANGNSLWKYDFTMSGGAGGAQFLNDLSDVDTMGAVNNDYLQFNGLEWVPTHQSGTGHTMKPEPDATKPVGQRVTEEDVVEYFKSKYPSAYDTNNEVASIFALSHWTNVKRIRKIYNGTIGHTGIGTWYDGEVPSEYQSDWWEDEIFALLDNSDPLVTGYDVDFDIKVDPSSEPVTLGGWKVDTTTQKCCIRFANYVIDPTKVKIAVDVTFTRTDVSVTV